MGITGVGNRSYPTYTNSTDSTATNTDLATTLRQKQALTGTGSTGTQETSFEEGGKRPHGHHKPPFADDAAKALGYDTANGGTAQFLQDWKTSGETLEDFAKSKVGSSDGVKKDLSDSLSAKPPPGVTDVSGMVDSIMTRKAGEHGGPGGPGGPGGKGGPLSDAASVLGYSDTDSLIADLQSGSGTSIEQLAMDKGLDPTDVATQIAKKLQPNAPDGATSSEIDDMVQQMMQQVGLPQRPGGSSDDATMASFRASDLQRASISAT